LRPTLEPPFERPAHPCHPPKPWIRASRQALGAGTLERLCTGATWSEGPVWLNESAELLWSDIPNNRMLAWQAGRGLHVWREACDFTNGHVREWRDGRPGGALLHCSHGRRAIVRTRLDAHRAAHSAPTSSWSTATRAGA
jgi:sugar lactone lactonase YvrE